MKGVGTDILSVKRIAATMERTGDRFVCRILAPEERDRIDTGSPHALAKAFAAKEAVAKALGTGFRQGVGWHDIRIERDALGCPSVSLHAAARERCSSVGASRVLLSLSDEEDYVVAFAVVV